MDNDDLLENESPDDELLRNSVKKSNDRPEGGASSGSKQAAELLAKEGGKAALEAYGVPKDVADKVVDKAANDKMVKKGIDQAAKKIDSNPMAKAAVNSEAGKDAMNTGASLSGVGLNSEDEESESSGEISGNEESSEDSEGSGTSSFSAVPKVNPIVVKFALFLAPYLFLLIIIMVVINIIASPVNTAWEYIKSIWNNTVGAFIRWIFPDKYELEKRYYEKLNSVKNEYDSKYEICIDTNLITATLTINADPEEFFSNTSFKEGEEYEKDDESSEDADYEKMTKQISFLAKMQFKEVHYGWDSSLSGKHCKDSGTTSYDPVTSNDIDNYIAGISNSGTSILPSDSSSAIKVAGNDGVIAFNIGGKVVNEVNREFVFYRPVVDSEGKCDYDLPPTDYEVSVGDYETREDSVYYWNLVNQFIPAYYKDYINEHADTDEEKKAMVIEIADNIYKLYDSFDKVCESTDSFSDYFVSGSDICPSGVMVKDKDGNIKAYDLETYVAGVVSAENSWYQGGNIENMKAQAVAARTYVVSHTSECSVPIENSSSSQNFRENANEYARKAANETAGIVMKRNGSYISAEYDAFCVTDNSDSEFYTIMQKGQRIPKSFAEGEGKAATAFRNCLCNQQSVFTRDKYPNCWKYNKDTGKYSYLDGGHGRGMSQIGSRYLQSIGYNYEQILHYYYGDDVELHKSSNYGTWAAWRQKAPAPWSEYEMPHPATWTDSGGKLHQCTKIANCGCAITSVAIQIARSGVQTSLGSSFNPGSFYLAIKNGGFSGNGIIWNSPHNLNVAPDFVYAGSQEGGNITKIKELISSGYFIVANVNNGGHWVAVTGYSGDSLSMVDPAKDATDLLATYRKIDRYVYYKIGS